MRRDMYRPIDKVFNEKNTRTSFKKTILLEYRRVDKIHTVEIALGTYSTHTCVYTE